MSESHALPGVPGSDAAPPAGPTVSAAPHHTVIAAPDHTVTASPAQQVSDPTDPGNASGDASAVAKAAADAAAKVCSSLPLDSKSDTRKLTLTAH